MIDFSLVLIDSTGSAFFAAAEREALRGVGRLADVIYVRRVLAGDEEGHDRGEILMGTNSTTLELIRAGVERAICPHVVVVDVGSLRAYAGVAALALELTDDFREGIDDEDDRLDAEHEIDLVAAQVVDAGGSVLFRSGMLALDGQVRVQAGGELVSETRRHRPTLLSDPRAFAGKRDMLLATWRGGMPADPTSACELAWRCWVLGGRAVTSTAISVVADQPAIPESSRVWKASLARLLEPETLALTPEGATDAGFDFERVALRLLRIAGLAGPMATGSMASRTGIQRLRKRPDEELFGEGLLADSWNRVDLAAGVQPERRRIAILCSDSIGTSMAGPAIRSIELARVLGQQFDVRIAAHYEGAPPTDLPCPVHELGESAVDDLLEWAGAVVLQGPLTHWYPQILRSELPIAIDLYDPMNLEALESIDPDALVPYTTNLLRDQLWRGDYFFCASERQRDFWLGMLAACGRITPGRYAEDPDLDALIGIVPYGITGEPPVRTGPGVRAELGIGEDDPLFVWNGGIWQWFDPDLLVLAIARLREELPDIRALFMGVRRPGSAPTREALRLHQLIDEHDLRDQHVFVREWTPYEDRADTYLDATAVVSLHHAHIETRFSFRTRLLDCIWAAIPIVCTTGDVLAPVVLEADVGITVPAGDIEAIVDALRAMATDPERVADMRSRLRELAVHYTWVVAAAPLVAWAAGALERQNERFTVTGLDPALADAPQIVAPSLGLKKVVPRPIRQHVLGPLKRRLRASI